MKKEQRDILTIILIFITLSLFILLIFLMPTQDSNAFSLKKIISIIKNEKQETQKTDYVTPTNPKITIWDYETEEPTEIIIKNNTGSFSNTQKLIKKDSVWSIADKEYVELDNEKLQSLILILQNPPIKKSLGKKENRNKELGFSPATFTVEIKKDDKTSHILEIGSIVPSGYDCYVKTPGTIDYYIADGFLYTLVNQNLLTYQLDGSLFFPFQREINLIQIHEKNKQMQELSIDSDGNAWIEKGYLNKRQKLSNSRSLYESGLTPLETIYEKLKNISDSSVIETGSNNWKKYGLKEPKMQLTISGIRGRAYKTDYYFGNTDETGEKVYFRTSNSEKIYQTENRYINGLRIENFFQIIDKHFFTITEGINYQIEIENKTKSEEDYKIKKYEFASDSNEKESQSIWSYISQVEVDLEIPQEISQNTDDYTYKITINPQNKVIYIIPYDFVFYSVQTESGNFFLIHKKKIETPTELLLIIKSSN